MILLLLFVNFWGIKPFGLLTNDQQLIVLLIYLLYGCYKYRKRKQIRICNKYLYLKWIVLSILLSMIPAFLFYNQSIIQSIITYRTQFLLPCTIITMFVISPKLEEIMKALLMFSAILLGANILKKVNPNLFVISDEVIERVLRGDMSALNVVIGVEYITILLFYYLQKIKEKFTLNDFYKSLFCFLVIFMTENRSSIFPAAVFMIYTFAFVRSKYKVFIWIMCAFIVVTFTVQNVEVITSLLDETTAQLDDEDYNRNKALMMYLWGFNPHWLCYILGNGFLSAHSSRIMQTMMDNGVYNSDVGFIGYWNQFGLIPIIAMFMMYVKTLRSKIFPYFMKLIVAFSVVCGVTIIYYGMKHTMMHFVLFYYLFFYFTERQMRTEERTIIH